MGHTVGCAAAPLQGRSATMTFVASMPALWPSVCAEHDFGLIGKSFGFLGRSAVKPPQAALVSSCRLLQTLESVGPSAHGRVPQNAIRRSAIIRCMSSLRRL